MSIEQSLAENTAAVRALTAAIASMGIPQLPAAANPQLMAPSIPPVPPAPSTAAAAPQPIALVAPTDTSLVAPTSVFGQAALPPGATPAAVAPLIVPPVPVGNAPLAQVRADLDKNGIPWDGRIHASSKAKIADGSWRTKRGVDETLLATVTAELKQAVSAAPPVSAFGAHPFGEGEVPPPPVSAFARMMATLPGMMGHGLISADQVSNACVKVGVASIPALAAREDLVPAVAAELGIAL